MFLNSELNHAKKSIFGRHSWIDDRETTMIHVETWSLGMLNKKTWMVKNCKIPADTVERKGWVPCHAMF